MKMLGVELDESRFTGDLYAGVMIHDNAKIGGNARFGDGSLIGDSTFYGIVRVGEKCIIENDVVVYGGSCINDGCAIHRGVVVNADSAIDWGSTIGKFVSVPYGATIRCQSTIGDNAAIAKLEIQGRHATIYFCHARQKVMAAIGCQFRPVEEFLRMSQDEISYAHAGGWEKFHHVFPALRSLAEFCDNNRGTMPEAIARI